MSDAANKSTAGSSTYFRRQKIIPSVVARKIGSTSKLVKASVPSAVKETTATHLSNNNEEQSVKALPAATPEQTLPGNDVSTPEKSLPEAEVSTGVPVQEERKDAPIRNPSPPPSSSAKPATAFRRIKPKVAILPQLKPAKSILKKTNTISKETLPSSSENTAGIIVSKEDAIVLPTENSESVTAKDDAPQDGTEKMLVDGRSTSSQQTSHDKELIDTTEQTEKNPVQSVQHVLEEKSKTDAASPSTENVVVGDLTVGGGFAVRQESDSVSETPNTDIRIDNTPPASDTTAQDASKQSISDKLSPKQSTPSVSVAGTKTIKRAIPLGKLPADLTNLLKSHIKKKGKTVPPKDVAVASKPPPITNQRTDSPAKEHQENQENQKEIVNTSNVPSVGKDQLLLGVEPSKAAVENGSTPTDKSPTKEQLIHEPPLLESRPDNGLNQPTKVPPSPAVTSVPPEASGTVQSSGVKKIQKVHKLTNETKLLLMNSLKKGKTKPPAKTPSVKSDVLIADPPQALVDGAPAVEKKPPSKDERKVNIISNVVLPRLFNGPGQIPSTQGVSSFATPSQQPVFPSFPYHPTTMSIAAPSTVTQPLPAQPNTEAPDSASQYPKVFIIGHDINASLPTTHSTGSPLKPVVSVTVLPPQTAGSSPDIPTTPSRHLRLPAPVVTVQRTMAPYPTCAAPPSLPAPIVSVTMTPGKVSNEPEPPLRMDVPVDPRIVPRIVIEGCDSNDLDSLSSFSSTSSSSSSFERGRAPKSLERQQQPEVGRAGCSPKTLKMLHAKILENMKQKCEQNAPPPPEPPKKMVRQYGRQSDIRRCVPEITITPEQAGKCTTMQKHVPHILNANHFTASNDPERNASNLETSNACNLTNILENHAPCDERPESAKSGKEQHILEGNEFFGFSNASIENAEHDFEDRARTIDWVLQATRECSTGMSAEEHNETVEECLKLDSKNTCTNILAECSEAHTPGATEPSAITLLDKNEENVPELEPSLSLRTAVEDSVTNNLAIEEEDHHQQDDSDVSQDGFVEEKIPLCENALSLDKNQTDKFTEEAVDDEGISTEATKAVRDVPMQESPGRARDRVDESHSAVEVLKPSSHASEVIEELSQTSKSVSQEVVEELDDIQQLEQPINTQEPSDLNLAASTTTEKQKDKSNPVMEVDKSVIPVQVPVALQLEKSETSPTMTEEQKDISNAAIEVDKSEILVQMPVPQQLEESETSPTMTEEQKDISNAAIEVDKSEILVQMPVPQQLKELKACSIMTEEQNDNVDKQLEEQKLVSSARTENQSDKSHSLMPASEPSVPVPAPIAHHSEESMSSNRAITEKQTEISAQISIMQLEEPKMLESVINTAEHQPEAPKQASPVLNVEENSVVEVEEPQIPVPLLSDQETTGVDVIIAMARMRRENRVKSVDDGSDVEELRERDDELLITPGTPIKPLTSGYKKQKSKKKRKRRKKRRDEFVQLLLKHVNLESLIADVVQQEKQRFGYVSSPSESDEERSLSPLERYIRGQARERQQNNTAEVVVETDDFTASSEESLVEEKILSIFLKKESEVSCEPGCSTSTDGVRAAQSDEPVRQRSSEICDTSAYTGVEEINEPKADKAVTEFSIECYDKTCDKIDTANETNVKQFDVSTACESTSNCDNTTSHAIVAKEEPVEVHTTAVASINTQLDKSKEEQVVVQKQHLGGGRKSRKRFRERAAKPTAGRRVQPKRTKLNAQTVTPPVEMPLFDSSDAPHNEVVSDCSTDGLSSTVEVSAKRESPLKPAKREVSKSGRGKTCGRRTSSSGSSRSSSRNSNSNRYHAASGDDDLSSGDGEPKMAKRRRLRRKKRSSMPVRNNLALKSTTFTVDYRSTDDPSVSATTVPGSRSTDMSSHMSSTASKHSKASSTDAAPPTYAIPDDVSASGEGEQTAASRPRQMIRVRNSRALLASPPPPPEPPVEQQQQKMEKKKRGRGGAAKQKAANGGTADSIPNELTNEAPGEETEMVKCGYCQANTLPELWQEHYNYHNGATYRVGIDPPIDLKDIKAMSAVIQRFMKVQRRIEVQCERCGEIKKSGVGMASHLQTCGLSELELENSKATCHHCGRKMKAVSMPIHQQQHCKVLKELQKKQAAQMAADGTPTDEPSAQGGGRKKRKSVANAELLIKKLTKEINEETTGEELVRKITAEGLTDIVTQCCSTHVQQSKAGVCEMRGCAFQGMTEEKIRKEHSFQEDGTTPKPLYQCIKCTHTTVNEGAILEHVRLVHSDLIRKAAIRHGSLFGSDGDTDTYVASGNGTTSDDSALDEEMEEQGGKGKKGKGKKQQNGKSKKAAEDGSGSGKKAAAKKTTAGSKTNLSDQFDGFVAMTGNDEAEVYKEMVFQESVDFKADKANYYLMSVKWTQEFRKEHYTARLLFGDMRPDVDISFLRSTFDARSYLPRTIRSMRYVQCNSKQYDPGYRAETFATRWQQIGTFNGEAIGCEQIFFTGGPVMSLDWLPLPDDAKDADQFLAIACKQTYDEYFNCEELSVPRPRKCLVQIWNVGPLCNPRPSLVTARSPRLAFAIACDYGPIWQIAFCPSGCYNETAQGDDFERLGLLAVAGSDGDVHLYALDRTMAVPGDDIKLNAPRVWPLQPVMLLSLSFRQPSYGGPPASDFTGRSVLCIAWSREKGHNVLAAGYSNGVVAVWNLAAKSSLVRGMKDDIRTLLPVHKILHSSSSSITALDLHYSSGTRFLVVCNADRRLKIYDLRCGLYQPLETLSTTVRSRIPAIRWLLHFPVVVITYDDSLCIDRCAYTVHQPRDIGLRMFGIFSVGAEMTDLGPNDWLSMNAITTSGGDLVCHRSVPFVFGMNYKKFAQVLTTTISIKLKSDDDSADVSRYDAFSQEYGLLFSDTDKVPTAMDTAALHLKSWRRGKLGHYPAVRLNQIRWNPNSSSYSYYAIGYQAGFVRIRVLRT